MKNLLKGAFVAGALAVSVTAFADEAEAQPMMASWYGPGFAGQPTASGAIFDPQAMTAAHKTLPFGTELRVCYQDCTVVTVNDRGPYSGGRDLDLSAGAAQAVGLDGVGVVDVTILGQNGAPASGQSALKAVPASGQQDETQAAPASTNAGAYQGGETYTVQSGDTLYGIAQQHGTSVEALAAANDISNVALIFPGEELSIPGGVAA